jgi:hypothetical protein
MVNKNKPSNQPLKLVGVFDDVEFNKSPLQISSHHDGTPILQWNASISIKKRNKLSNRPLKLVGAFHAVEFNKLPLWVPGHHDRTPILEGIIIKIAPSN